MRFLVLLFLILGMLAFLTVVAIPLWIALIFAVWRLVMPWLFIGFVIWAAFAISGRPRPRRWHGHSYERVPPTQAPQNRSWTRTAPVHVPLPAAKPELPIDVQVKVEQIRRKVDVLLGYASRFPPFSQDLFIVRQTASDYLPRTIDAYLALPPGRGDQIIVPGGKTALQELKEQLDLLDGKLNDIAEDLQRHDLERLLANRRFLEDKFGRTAK